MTLFEVKLLITLVLLLVTLLFSFLPGWILQRASKSSSRNGNGGSRSQSGSRATFSHGRTFKMMSLMTCLAGGVIMGSLLFHLLPEIFPIESSHSHSHDSHADSHSSHDESHAPPYKWGALAAGLSFFCLLGK